MKEQLVGFEVAKLAKKKGFKFDSSEDDYHLGYHSYFVWHNDQNRVVSISHYENDATNSGWIPLYICAPTQALLQKWLREVHKLEVWILPTYRKGKCDYDAFFKNGYTFEVTKDECHFLDCYSFLQHLDQCWFYENETEEERETFQEFLNRVGKSIFDDYESCLEEGLKKALEVLPDIG